MIFKKIFMIMMVGIWACVPVTVYAQSNDVSNPAMGMPSPTMNVNPMMDAGIPNAQGNPMGAMPGRETMPVDSVPAPTVLNIETIPPELRILKKVEEQLKSKFKSNIYTPANIPSLFFTAQQQSLLNSARQGFNNALPEDLAGLDDGDKDSLEELVPSVSEIILGGILYNGSEDWVIWLNGVRTTKTTLPRQVIDIQVGAEYVQLKWFDEATNQIFPVRLRPNQKFDITKKVFLPAG